MANQGQPRPQGLIDDFHARVTVIWVSPCFWYPRTQIPIQFGFPWGYPKQRKRKIEANENQP